MKRTARTARTERTERNATAPNASGDETMRVNAARVEALYGFAKPAYVTTLVIAAIMIVVLWGPMTADVLVAWFLAVTAVTLARIFLHWRYARSRDAGSEASAWERRFTIGALAAGCIWAFAPIVLFPASEPLLQAVLVFVVVGSGLGAVGVYGSSMSAFIAFITFPMCATFLQLAVQPGRSYQLLAMMVLVFTIVAFWVYRGIHFSFVDSLRNRLRNESLSARVAASEARLRDAIESFPEGIAVYDERDHLVICNDGYARTYGGGRSAGALAGVHYREVAGIAFEVEALAPEEARDPGRWIDARLQRRHLQAGSIRIFQLRDGRWLQGRFERTRAGGSISVFTDISEARRAQDAYQAVRTEENLVLDTVPLGLAFIEDRILVRCNAQLERMLGYGAGELAGRSMRDLYATARWEDGDGIYSRLGDGRVFEADGILRRKDGSTIWVSAQARAVDPKSPRQAVIATFADVTARRNAERALAHSEAMYRNLVETSNDLIWSVDKEGRWTYMNAAAARRIYGRESAELLGRPFREVLAQEVLERDLAIFSRILEGEQVQNYETRHLRADGSPVDLAFNAIALRNERGEAVGTTGTARDITEEKRAAAELYASVEKLRLATDAADLYYWEWDVIADRLLWGRDPTALIGPPDERSRQWPDLRKLVHPDDLDRYLQTAQRALETGATYACEFRIVTLDGELRWVSATGRVQHGTAGRPSHVIGVSRDVTGAKRSEEEVRFLAYHDTLTGLPNRRLLDDRLRQAVFLAQRRDARIGVLLLDLDGFKQVNDTLGHRAGDATLREISRRFASCVRKADTLARQGGDEFVIVVPDLAAEADCQVVADKILRALEPACRIDGREFRIGASIGISVFPADAGDPEALLRNADVAMYRAKQLGKNNYCFYSR